MYNIACKKLLQDFQNYTQHCYRYDNCYTNVSSEIAWIKSNFAEFDKIEHKSDIQHLAGAIQYDQSNKIFISNDWVFKKLDNIKINKEKLDMYNLDIYSPKKYINSPVYSPI